MGTIDPSRLLAAVRPDRPCGDDLEYDAEFLALQQAAAGKPEQRMGDQVLPGEEPNWKLVRQLAQQLLLRTKDLRSAVPLCRALLHTDGFAGLADGLAVLHGLVEQFWPNLYPLLDADDHDDPTMRVNVLASLGAAAGMLKSLREVPLVQARVAGSFSLRDVDIGSGRAPAPAGSTPPSAELIAAAFQEVPAEQLASQAEAVQRSQERLRQLAALLDSKLGGRSPDLRPLGDALAQAAAELQRHLARRGLAAPPADGVAAPAATPSAVGGSTPGGSMQIQSREDVIAWLDRICEFYRRTEPSSPVPILLQRARGLVNKSFLDVIRDLVPEALSQAEAFRGQVEST